MAISYIVTYSRGRYQLTSAELYVSVFSRTRSTLIRAVNGEDWLFDQIEEVNVEDDLMYSSCATRCHSHITN